MSALKQYQGEVKRQPKRKRFTDEPSNEEIETTSRVDAFLVILDRMRTELERMHNVYVNFKEKFSFLKTMGELSTSTQRVTEKAQSLVQYYSNYLEDDLVQENIHFSVTFLLIRLQRNLNQHHYSIVLRF